MRYLTRYLRYDWPLHFVLFFTNWLPDNVVFLRVRGWLARWFIGKCGSDLRLGRQVVFHNPVNIHIGNHVLLTYGCMLMATDLIVIKDEVMFGPYCVVISGNHTRKEGSFRNGNAELAPIFIGSGSWLGSHVIVTAGAKIGQGTVIGAGAVVADAIPNDVAAGGVPARIIKTLD